jgi:hypothetical protein
MATDEIELFVTNTSALMSDLHVLSVILIGAASCHCQESFLLRFLVILVSLLEEVHKVGVSEDLCVHAVDDCLNCGLST